MKKAILAALMLSAAASTGSAVDVDGYGSKFTVGPITIISDGYGSETKFLGTKFDDVDEKVILNAKDDAALFLATQGQERTAKINQALTTIRTNSPALQASDLELAAAILDFK